MISVTDNRYRMREPKPEPKPETILDFPLFCDHCGELVEYCLPKTITLGPISIRLDRNELLINSKKRKVRGNASLRLLTAMISKPGMVFSREQVWTLIRRSEEAEDTKAVDIRLSYLRRDLADVVEIQNHWGLGWSLHLRLREGQLGTDVMSAVPLLGVA